MCDICTYNQVQVNAYDPSRTLTLRNAFARAMRTRFNELERVIREAVISDDVFGLQTYQMTTPGREAFNFPRSSDKVEAFMRWLNQQVDRGILQTITLPQVGEGMEQAWTNTYIYDSYKRGVIRARYELNRAGYAPASIEASGGIPAIMSTPFHVDRVGLLYSRVFSDLKGVTTTMDTHISRVLAQGIADGDGTRLLARKLLSTINGKGAGDLGITDTLGRFIPAKRRAEMLARTEVIRAHHQATIQEYRSWGVAGVEVIAEFTTAGDDRVCDVCASMHGNRYTLEQIEPMIPVHPLCRCVAIPVVKR